MWTWGMIVEEKLFQWSFEHLTVVLSLFCELYREFSFTYCTMLHNDCISMQCILSRGSHDDNLPSDFERLCWIGHRSPKWQKMHVQIRFSMLKLYCTYAYNMLAIWLVCTVGAAAFSMLIYLYPEYLFLSKVVMLEFSHAVVVHLIMYNLWI